MKTTSPGKPAAEETVLENAIWALRKALDSEEVRQALSRQFDKAFNQRLAQAAGLEREEE